MPYFAVRRAPGPAWNRKVDMRMQLLWPEHAAFMNALADEGFVLLGGPLREGDETLLVIRADNADDVVSRLALDPWEIGDIFRTLAVDRWTIMLGSTGAT